MDSDMGVLAWIIMGLICGWFMSALDKGRSKDILSNLSLGVLGAVVGGFLANANGGILASLFISFIGGVIIIGIVRRLVHRRMAYRQAVHESVT